MAEKTLIIDNATTRKYMDVETAIRLVEDTFRWHGEDKIIMPSKITTDMSSAGINSWFNSMPSYIGPMNAAGIKVVGGYGDNRKRGMPYIKANVLLTDPSTGELKALLCGDWISDIRTGAQPAVTMKYLAAKTEIITIIGAGLQAYHSVLCMSKLFDTIQEVRVCDIRPEAREKFAAYFPDAPFKVVPYASNKEACEGADVIATITTADAVLVEADWCKPGCLVMSMGSYTELADDVPEKFDKIMIDHIGQGLHRGNFKKLAEEGKITPESFDATIPEVIAGVKKGRTSPEERIVVEIIGMGSHDLTLAAETYNRIVAQGEKVLSVDMMG
jgi:alanine dehydrogenase